METLVRAMQCARWATAAERLDDAVADAATLRRATLTVQAMLNWHDEFPIHRELDSASLHLREALLALERAAAAARAARAAVLAEGGVQRQAAHIASMLAIP